VKPAVKFVIALIGSLAAAGAAFAGTTDDRSRTESLLTKVEAQPNAKSVAKSELSRARATLERARGARAAGDHTHGAMLEALALEWAQAAEELVRTIEIERKAADVERKLAEAEAKTLRSRTLIEQTVARRGRAQEKLREVEQQAKGKP
jgi:hypothetical protein